MSRSGWGSSELAVGSWVEGKMVENETPGLMSVWSMVCSSPWSAVGIESVDPMYAWELGACDAI